MKILLILILTLVIGISSLFAQTPTPSPPIAPNGSDSVNIPVQDLKVFRQAVADKVFFESKSKQLEENIKSCQQEKAEWKKLYQSEQNRADYVQGERINNLNSIINEKELRIQNYITQANQFRDENLVLSADNQRLRKQRWKIGAITFGVGLGVGGVAGNRLP